MKPLPTPGTKAFAEHCSDHFISMVDMMRDAVGEEFATYCAFCVATKFDEKNEHGLILNARGNISVSVRMVADLIDLAAMNITKENGEINYQDALSVVLQGIQKELTAMQREPREPQ